MQSSKSLTENALDANKAHQYLLTKHAERLMADIKELDKLMSAVTTDDYEDGIDIDADVQISGAIKATSPCLATEFLNSNSPFYHDASKRAQYLNDTVDHPMKAKELDALAEAVKQENVRLRACAFQQSGQSDVEFDIENNTEGINWSIVAEKVNSSSGSTSHTAEQYRIKWLGDRHPRLNHGEWTPAEVAKVKSLVSSQMQENSGIINWVQIANELGTNRTPIDCMRHGTQRARHTWNAEGDRRLADAVDLYGTYNWNIVARYVSEDATASQCQVRYARAIDPCRKRGPWTEDELARLKEAVAAYGTSWVEVAACMPGRTNEQCRERWSEHLNPNTSEKVWTEEDDLALLRAMGECGNRWKEISTKMGNGTTGQQVQNQEGEPTPSSRPRPRPIGKGKAAARTVERDPAIETPVSTLSSAHDSPQLSDGPEAAPSTLSKKKSDKRGSDGNFNVASVKAKRKNSEGQEQEVGTLQTKSKKKSRTWKSVVGITSESATTSPTDSEPTNPRPKPRPRTRTNANADIQPGPIAPAAHVPPDSGGLASDLSTSSQTETGRCLRSRTIHVPP
ncbi:hypothetical protein H0H93_007706 [Arthromyces matolae]|nr:hypothetical protein H0H93_007706 [Arthromyces matolae]